MEKRYLYSFILLFSVSFNLNADICDFLYRPNLRQTLSPDLKLIAKLNRIEGRIKLLRKFSKKSPTGNSLYHESIKLEFKMAEAELFKGNSQLAVETYRTLYRKTESSALLADSYKTMINGVEKGIKLDVKDFEKFLQQEGISSSVVSGHINEINVLGPEKFISNMHKQLRKQQRILGNQYDKYEYVRSKFDELVKSADCKKICQQEMKRLNSEIGITSDTERHLFRAITQEHSSVSMKMIKDIYSFHPESRIISRRKEFFTEAASQVKRVLNNTRVIGEIYKYFGSTEVVHKLKLTRLFKRLFDKRAHGFNGHIIKKVTHAQITPLQKVKLLEKEIGAKIDKKSVLVDFSRSSDLSVIDSWAKMKVVAQQKNQGLFDLMQEAEAIGKKIGRVSIKKPNAFYAVLGNLLVGGAFISYFTFSKDKTDVTGDENQVELEAGNIAVDEDGNLINTNTGEIIETDNGNSVITETSSVEEIEITDEDRAMMLEYNSEFDKRIRGALEEVTDDLSQLEINSN